MRKKVFLIFALLFVVIILLVVCDDIGTSKSFKYHKANISTLSNVVDSSLAEKVLNALESSDAIEKDTKLVAEDIIKYSDTCFELYAGLMVRFYLYDDEVKLYTFETSYSDESAILLYDSMQTSQNKTLSATERKSLIYTQRRYVVHTTIRITPRNGSLLHNALGSTMIQDLTFTNLSNATLTYVSITITPYSGGTAYSSHQGMYVLDNQLGIGQSYTTSLTKSNWMNYSSYKISSVTIIFSDGTTIGLDSFDCQFLDGDGESPSTIINDSTITYHLYDNETKTENYYSGFGKILSTPYRYGYTFMGWYDNDNYSGNVIERIAIGEKANLELYAKWEEKPHVNYHYQYDDKVEKVYIEPNQTYSVLTPTRYGYTFGGWYDNNTFDGSKIAEVNIDSGKVDLYAQWNGNTVYIIFDGNGSTSGTMEKQRFVVGETQVLNANQFVKDGYTFVGWTLDKTSNDIIEDESDYTMFPTHYDVIRIYAKWAKEIKTVADFNEINENNTGYYSLMNDIDFINQEAITIETFYGIFEGNGYILKNSQTSPFHSNEGLIKNVVVSNCGYAKTNNTISGFLISNRGTISNCAFISENVIISDRIQNFGGFSYNNSGTILNSYANINITLAEVTSGIGGFIGTNGIGSNSEFGLISNCYVIGNIIVQSKNKITVGGFVCSVLNSKISNCYSNVDISVPSVLAAGGFIGSNQMKADFINCFSLGKMNFENLGIVGGFAGNAINCNYENVFRSDINLFESTYVTSIGTLVNHSQFYDKQFYLENNILQEYVDDTHLQSNPNAVWVIEDNELPKLYWEK